jgi:acyl-CoA thioester hydrolase
MPQREPFRFQTRIRYIDTDASGRIHYTSMFRYFESAEIELMRSLDIFYGPSGYAFPRVHVECDFKGAMVHDDVIDIEVFLARVGRSSVRLEFRTLKSGELVAKGLVVIACMDLSTQRSTPIPEEIRAKLNVGLSGSAEPDSQGG